MITSVERITRGVSPVTVPELTAWLRVDSSDETIGIFTMLIDAASDSVQEYIGRAVAASTYRKTWTYSLNDCFFVGPVDVRKKYRLEIPYPMITSISSLVWRSSAGVDTPITNYLYNVEGVIEIIGSTIFTASVVEIVCQYNSTPEFLPAVKMAILKMAAYMYERRGDCDSDEAMQNSGAAGLLAPYRRVLL